MTETAASGAPQTGATGDTTQIDEIRAGYAFDGAVLRLGAAVVDGQAHADAPVQIPLSVLNRHGLVAGATGTGKTKTLQLMAEQLSDQGVPVFLADMKGDLSGLATPGEGGDKITSRAADVGMPWTATAYPTEFFSLGGKGEGISIRATITSFGPTLLSKVLGLNDTQESSLGLIFHYADKNGLALLDLKDLRAVITHLTSDEGKADLKDLGGLSSATAGVILRNLITFEDQGAGDFFGEPEFETSDLLRTAADGRGMISCLELPQVQDRPQLFSTFLMWMLADLFHDLPEEGDLDKPKLVFFFDEAHLLFDDASKAFLQAIEQTVRLIRSKGIGVFFVTQSPKDVPAGVLAQLGNRVQHALRAFTPDDAKALKQAIATYPHTAYDMEKLLTSLGIGEAVVTVLSDRGVPTPGRVDPDEGPELAHGPLAPGDDGRRHRRVAAQGEVCRRRRPRVGLREARGPAPGGPCRARRLARRRPRRPPLPRPRRSAPPRRSRASSSRSPAARRSSRCSAPPARSSAARSPAASSAHAPPLTTRRTRCRRGRRRRRRSS